MLQNETEIYNLGLGKNARYFDGRLQAPPATASKSISKKAGFGKPMPKRDDVAVAVSPDKRLKLKALLRPDADDPYAFSEPEQPQALKLHRRPAPSNTYSRRKIALTSSRQQARPPAITTTESHAPVVHQVPMAPAPAPPVTDWYAEKLVLDEVVEDASKTLNRLQAKIARNKVSGKHKKLPSTEKKPALQHKKERSLLEEQLLAVKSETKVKKELTSPTREEPRKMVSLSAKQRRFVEPLQQGRSLQQAHQVAREYKRDLYPLGVEVSDSEGSDSDDSSLHFQRHWFPSWVQGGAGMEQREAHLSLMRAELRRRLGQVSGMGATLAEVAGVGSLACTLVKSARTSPGQTARFLRRSCPQPRSKRCKWKLPEPRRCSYGRGESGACSLVALPCTQHCARHIMYNVDQLLFEHCTAKFSDNTQCCVPVFDVCHELPLCLEHARKRDNYDKMCAATKPKKVRKKAKPSAMTRPSKRGKKKRRPLPTPGPVVALLESQLPQIATVCEVVDSCSPAAGLEEDDIPDLELSDKEEHLGVQEEEVLAMAEVLPLDAAELTTQATRLLEEHDLTNVLNQIPPDAFNDLFTEDKNGEYEPTREETEELERALEAVDKDVKSLEKLSQTQGLLDTLIDEHALVQTLAHLPDTLPAAFTTAAYHHNHNGYVVNGPTKLVPAVSIVKVPADPAPTQTRSDLAS